MYKEAIIAVTLNCNSRCLMCDIWKNKIPQEVKPQFYLKLPKSLREINITGGEPFLRNDLPEVIRNIKTACPKARLLINTNGYLFEKIKKMMPQILEIDPKIAFRVSLDGTRKIHDSIRRLPHYYDKALKTLFFLKKIGIKDLGVSFTLIKDNLYDLLRIYNLCKKNDFDFSLTTTSDSDIYFGKNKTKLRPLSNKKSNKILDKLVNSRLQTHIFKDWYRAWFDNELRIYLRVKKRRYVCSAGTDFFYLDSLGRVFSCHIKPWKIVDLNKQSLRQASHQLKRTIHDCQDCWMICTARSAIKKNILSISKEVLFNKLKAVL